MTRAAATQPLGAHGRSSSCFCCVSFVCLQRFAVDVALSREVLLTIMEHCTLPLDRTAARFTRASNQHPQYARKICTQVRFGHAYSWDDCCSWISCQYSKLQLPLGLLVGNFSQRSRILLWNRVMFLLVDGENLSSAFRTDSIKFSRFFLVFLNFHVAHSSLLTVVFTPQVRLCDEASRAATSQNLSEGRTKRRKRDSVSHCAQLSFLEEDFSH